MRGRSLSVASVIVLVLFGYVAVTGQSKAVFRDFSQKGQEYSELAGLRIAADDVVYSGEDSIKIFDNAYPSSKYTLSTTVKVQTLCAVGAVSVQTYENVPAEFEILVAKDKDNAVRNELLKLMNGIWSKKELYSGEYFFDFISNDSGYALTAMPDLVNVKGYYYIWLNGRIVKIIFSGLKKESGGWGSMDSFTAENLRIEIGDSLFRAYTFPLSARKGFLKYYKAGQFGPIN